MKIKIMTRISIFLLCLCMIIPYQTSCAETDGTNKNPNEYDDGYYDGSTRAKTKGNLPDDINLNGETVGIFFSSYMELNVKGEEEETDMIYTSIYERNLKVENWLSVNLSFLPSDSTGWSEISSELSNLILTNDESIDTVIAGSNTLIQNKLYALFTDLNNTLYLDLREPWWNIDAISETSIDGRIYEFLYGDIMLTTFTSCGALFYNKELYTDMNPTLGPDHLYTMVKDKTWTLDQFYHLTNKTYMDRDGDQMRSNGDIYAFQILGSGEAIHYFAAGCDIEYYKRAKTGFPEITINYPKSVEFASLLYKIFYENNGSEIYYPNQPEGRVEHPHDFEDGRILFYLEGLGSALNAERRAMEDNYGIIPYPLWDEQQKSYTTLLHNSAAAVCVPYTAALGGYDRLEYIICPTLEAMAIESYRSVTENFYELALKSAYTRDDLASEMIDIIVEGSTKNLVYEYSTSLNGIGNIFGRIMSAKSTTEFATVYASIGEAANQSLRNLIKEYGETFG
ncbi:MAG: hypothetical protein IKB34_02230 [Clostridia bacterium]|nr:hypothetical protein [Clostridia bacterium]